MSNLNAKTAPKQKGKSQPVIEAGAYPCRLKDVIDLGVQNQRPYKGEEKPPRHCIWTTYEFLDEFCVDKDGEDDLEKPRVMGEDFPFNNLEVDLATSTKRYMALDPELAKEGDWPSLVNTPCVVTISNRVDGDNTYANISSVSAMRPKQAKSAAPLVGEASVFSLEDPDIELFNGLPDFLQKKIKSNLNYQGSLLQTRLSQKPQADAKEPVEEVLEGEVLEGKAAEGDSWGLE